MLIDIPSISLDIENFRHGAVATESEAIRVLLTDEKAHRVAELAEDIVNMQGLDPSSLLIVMNDASNIGHFIALEGNRRMTALKTLINPNLATGLPTYPLFKQLSTKFMSLGLSQVECVVLDRPAAFDWIKRKHYNAMGGKGVMAWNAIATARSDASEGRPPRWMMALNLIEKQGKRTDTITDGIASKTTTVERVLASRHMATLLGVTFDNKSGFPVAENGDEQALVKLIEHLLLAMTEEDFVETKVTSAALQLEYLSEFESENVRKTEPSNANSVVAGDATGDGAGSLPNSSGQAAQGGQVGGTQGGSAASAQNASAPTSTKSKPVRFRTKLADTGLRINNSALNKLYGELKRLNVETNPHIGSSMLRVFLEKSTVVFLEDMNIQCRNPGGWRDSGVKLRDKVAGVLNSIDAQKKKTNLSYVWDIANGVQGKVHTLDYLNHAIHDHESLPSARDIITIWDRFHPYLQELFSTLEKNGK
jgi:hypothetical protein